MPRARSPRFPDDEKAREVEARFSMLETLADHDDQLMEQLLEEIEPPRDEVFDDLAADLRDGLGHPGADRHGREGQRRAAAAEGHPPRRARRRRRRASASASTTAAATVVQVMKTIHTAHGGKLSVARILSGTVADGAELWLADGDERQGLGHLPDARQGPDEARLGQAPARRWRWASSTACATGETLTSARAACRAAGGARAAAAGLCHRAAAQGAQGRRQDVGGDPAPGRGGPVADASATTRTPARPCCRVTARCICASRSNGSRAATRSPIEARPPAVPYRETIRKATQQRGRHKKQSGGHGQFGDVVIEIKPLPRGSGFQFTDTITGGVVPKQYIQSVEAGVRDYLKSGPLGFPVVDIAVNLSDGSYHSVDSSDMAFQMAARLAHEGRHGRLLAGAARTDHEGGDRRRRPTRPRASPRIVPQRRGQILGYDARPGWPGWDVVEATMPQAEIGDLIVELRSATAGVASYRATFDHMAELTGRLADEVMNQAGGKAA